MYINKIKCNKGLISIGLLCVLWLAMPLWGEASDPRVQQATNEYLKGNRYLKENKYDNAIKSFRRAINLLPRNPHFNCHRAQFLNYIGMAQERMRKHYDAMRSYYTAGYQSGCKTAATTSYATKRYNALYNRWMSSIQITTTPPNARVVQITANGDQELGRSPFKKVFSPGKYKFKIRLYEYRTEHIEFDLRAGMHINRAVNLVKGDDPVNRPEKVDIAPPPPVSGIRPKDPTPTKTTKKEEIALINQSSSQDLSGMDPSGDISTLTGRKSIVTKPGPPVYKQAWFWAVIGGVVAAGVIIPIVIPKEQKVLINQGRFY